MHGSSTTHIDISHLAKLARLALSDEEKTIYTQQIENILSHIDAIKKVDVSTIEPTAHGIPLYNNFRCDEPVAGMPVEEVLGNAPSTSGDLIVVPKIVE